MATMSAHSHGGTRAGRSNPLRYRNWETVPKRKRAGSPIGIVDGAGDQAVATDERRGAPAIGRRLLAFVDSVVPDRVLEEKIVAACRFLKASPIAIAVDNTPAPKATDHLIGEMGVADGHPERFEMLTIQRQNGQHRVQTMVASVDAAELEEFAGVLERVTGRESTGLASVGEKQSEADRSVRDGRMYRLVKRAMDVGAALALGTVLLPLLLVVAVIIRMDSSGPALYRQTRVGQNGRRFEIYKFRSMRTDAEVSGLAFAQSDDPRVTRVGRYLRKMRIDELPQLWNVLRGEMSLVGPRPERPEMVAMIEAEVPQFALRTSLKPGLTGWAQVKHGYAATIDEMRTKLEFDLYYIRNASLRLDLKILLLTSIVIVQRSGQ